jgi:hypothetical protein
MKGNHPRYTGPLAFARAFFRVMGISVLGRLEGGRVLRPWIENRGWLRPSFREQLCLVVAINNHCVG